MDTSRLALQRNASIRLTHLSKAPSSDMHHNERDTPSTILETFLESSLHHHLLFSAPEIQRRPLQLRLHLHSHLSALEFTITPIFIPSIHQQHLHFHYHSNVNGGASKSEHVCTSSTSNSVSPTLPYRWNFDGLISLVTIHRCLPLGHRPCHRYHRRIGWRMPRRSSANVSEFDHCCIYYGNC